MTLWEYWKEILTVIGGIVAISLGIYRFYSMSEKNMHDKIKNIADNTCDTNKRLIEKRLSDGSQKMNTLELINRLQSEKIDKIENSIESIRLSPIHNGGFSRLEKNIETLISKVEIIESRSPVRSANGSGDARNRSFKE